MLVTTPKFLHLEFNMFLMNESIRNETECSGLYLSTVAA